MTASLYWHVGILLAALDTAIDRFSKALGLTFLAPMEQGVMLSDPEPRPDPSRAAYSTQGPPYIEPDMWLTDPADLHGVRLELVGEHMRAPLDAMLAAG